MAAVAAQDAPVVSVVIPTHDRADLLERAIESALRQSGGALDALGALEVVVVDDASTDQTAEIVARYGRAVVSLRNERNRERGSSRNLGAAAARGRWLAFLDSDDEWEDGKLAAQLDAVGAASACLAGCWLTDEGGGLLGTRPAGPARPIGEIDVINPYPAVPSALLVDRELFINLGGFPEERAVQGSEDWLFMAKLLAAGVDPIWIPEPLVRYRVHTGNSTASPRSYLPTTLAAVDWLERNELVSRERAALARAEKYERAARAHAIRGEPAAVLRCMRLALAHAPAGHRLALLRGMARATLRATTRRALPAWFAVRAT